MVSALVFAAIPLIKRHRENSQSNVTEMTGIIRSEHKQTFKIPQRSVSKGSLANEEAALDYGTSGMSPIPSLKQANSLEKLNFSQQSNGHVWNP